jgi:hypothetical protein
LIGATNGSREMNTPTYSTTWTSTPKFSTFPSSIRKPTLTAFTCNLKVSYYVGFKRQLIDGMLYFVKGNTIGSDFGFPRLGIKKRYKW